MMAVIGPLVWTESATEVDLGASLLAPSSAHPMGTDSLGRDVLARFNEGAQISLAVAVVVSFAGAVIGGAIGLLSGALGGFVDAVFMRVMDAVLAFPALILAMAVTVGLGVGVKTATIGIIITAIPWYARLVRSEAIRVRALPFVEAAAAIGATRTRIVARHIAPQLLSTLAIQSAAVFGYAILSLAALGFVGLGAQVPTPEWGSMITDGLGFALTGQWWIAVFPGIGVLLAVTATSMLADRARDHLDPRGHYAQL
jgi:peptide/nickel transport system permease protein